MTQEFLNGTPMTWPPSMLILAYYFGVQHLHPSGSDFKPVDWKWGDVRFGSADRSSAIARWTPSPAVRRREGQFIACPHCCLGLQNAGPNLPNAE